MRKPKYNTKFRGNFIAGKFRESNDPNGSWDVLSPANLDDMIAKVTFSYSDIDVAVDCARTAQRKWKTTDLSKRIECLKKYQKILKSREEEIVEVLSREVGKPLWESKTEVGAMIAKVDITINDSMKLIESFRIEKINPTADGVCHFKPLGVLTVIGPFNFPGHLPNGHIVPALLTGNSVIFKPSEKTPIVGQIMAECFELAGFPKGVFQLLQGERELSRRLCTHNGIDGVLFTGSYDVGTKIKQDTLRQHWKLIALEMGGKNSAIIWKDANLEAALRDTLVGAYITTGQRCSCTSRILIHEDIADEFISKYHQRAKAFKIGHPFENPFMGPLIDHMTMDRYMKFQDIAPREEAELVMRAKVLELEYSGYYVAPSITRMRNPSLEQIKKSVYQQTELFAPNVCFIPVKEIEEATEFSNATQYGLVSSIFSKSKSTFQKFFENLDTGLINWNTSTAGASSRLPFGGTKKSGNHWPTALPSTRYCTYPVASLEVAEPSNAAPNQPGLNWES